MDSEKASKAYDLKKYRYDNLSSFKKFFTLSPKEPEDYNYYIKNSEIMGLRKYRSNLMYMFRMLEKIYLEKNQNTDAYYSNCIYKDIEANEKQANEVLRRRSQEITYVDDLYGEAKN